jgi:hypothetical protein
LRDHDEHHERTADHDHDWPGVEHDHHYDAGWNGLVTVYYDNDLHAALSRAADAEHNALAHRCHEGCDFGDD